MDGKAPSSNVLQYKSWSYIPKFYFIDPNKALVSQQQKLAEIDVLDGGSIFAPKFITKKADCGTLIKKLW